MPAGAGSAPGRALRGEAHLAVDILQQERAGDRRHVERLLRRIVRGVMPTMLVSSLVLNQHPILRHHDVFLERRDPAVQFELGAAIVALG